MKPVGSCDDLSTSKYYSINAGSWSAARELVRFVGMAPMGATFKICDSIVRQDRAVTSVAIRPEKISQAVLEIEAR